MQGKIIKGIGGFYYVDVSGDNIYECKAKGSFRSKGLTPTVGDNVLIETIDTNSKTGNIVEICNRDSILVRPAIANANQAVVIFAMAEPEPNLNLLDRFLIMNELSDMETIICFNKSDLVVQDKIDAMKSIYEKCGYKVVCSSTYKNTGIDILNTLLVNRTTVMAGPSGVGKSSILNCLLPDAHVKTGEISTKIKRGKHTTRHSELIKLSDNTFIFDTPGFTSLYVEGIESENLKYYFKEFREYNGLCRFNGCAHINEPNCVIKDRVETGEVSRLRYNNYVQMYNELKNKRRW